MPEMEHDHPSGDIFSYPHLFSVRTYISTYNTKQQQWLVPGKRHVHTAVGAVGTGVGAADAVGTAVGSAGTVVGIPGKGGISIVSGGFSLGVFSCPRFRVSIFFGD